MTTNDDGERPARVRMAGQQDEDALYDLLLALELDNGLGIARSDDKVRAAILQGTRQQGAMIGVIDGHKGDHGEPGELAGSVCLVLSPFWYSDDWFLAEQWLFVRPEYRGNGHEDDLFRFARWCRSELSQKLGQDMRLVTSVSSRNRLPAKLRLWRRYGEQVGGLFYV